MIPRDAQRLLDKMEPSIRAAFLASFNRITSTADLKTISGMIAQNDVSGLIEALRLEPSLFGALDKAITDTYYSGGNLMAETMPSIRDPFGGGVFSFGFDGRHPNAERWVRDHSSTLIREILSDQRQSIRDVIEQSIRDGRNPNPSALDLIGRINPISGRREGGIIGLTSRQAQAVVRARQQLSSGDPQQMRDYLARARRDRRYDAQVRAAIKSGSTLSDEQVNNIAGKYSDRLLKLRGETIARTEAITALRAGRHEGYSQLLGTGAVEERQIIRKWDSSGDAKVRPDHVAMDGQEIKGMTLPFVAPDGSQLMYPGDISLGAPGDQTIMCRCYEQIEIDYLGQKKPVPPTPAPAKKPVDPRKAARAKARREAKKRQPEKPAQNFPRADDIEPITAKLGPGGVLSGTWDNAEVAQTRRDKGYAWARTFGKPKKTTALRRYQGVHYHSINSGLRNGKPPSSIPEVAEIDSMIGSHSVQADTVMYRSISNIDVVFPPERRVAGTRFADPGYVSASIDPSSSGGFLGSLHTGGMFRIVVPRGTKGVAMDTLKKQYYEGEFLLPRGTVFEYTGESFEVGHSGSRDARVRVFDVRIAS